MAGEAIAIEDHYSSKAGRPTPMDIEWTREGWDGGLYIVQARPETVDSRRSAMSLKSFAMKGSGPVLGPVVI